MKRKHVPTSSSKSRFKTIGEVVMLPCEFGNGAFDHEIFVRIPLPGKDEPLIAFVDKKYVVKGKREGVGRVAAFVANKPRNGYVELYIVGELQNYSNPIRLRVDDLERLLKGGESGV